MSIRNHPVEGRKYIDNPNARVYYYDKSASRWVERYGEPRWVRKFYKVVLPEYQEAWEAYLDNELETRFGGVWQIWPLDKDPRDAPCFDREEEHYRRKSIKEVLPCPFCGATAEHIGCGTYTLDHESSCWIESQLGFKLNTVAFDEVDEWNTRCVSTTNKLKHIVGFSGGIDSRC